MRIKILILLLMSSIQVIYSQENILDKYNGDFEDGMNYWRLFENPADQGSNAVTSSDAVSGDFALSLNFVTDFGQIIDRGLDNWFADVPVSEGVLYTLKAFVKGDINSTKRLAKVGFTFGFFDAAGNIISQRNRFFAIDTVYAEKSLQVKAPDGAVSCWVAFRLSDATDPCAPLRKMYIDNVRILKPYDVSVDPSFRAESLGLTNYPNPFVGQTTMSYHLAENSIVTMKVYNIFGQDIALIIDHQQQNAGNHEFNWAPENMEAGIYFYRLEVLSADNRKEILNRKMIIRR